MNRYQESLRKLSQNYEGADQFGGFGQKSVYPGVMPNRFGGSPSGIDFIDENQLAEDHVFSFTIQNVGTAAVDRNIALCPGYYTPEQVSLMKDNLGNAVDAIIREGLVIGTTANNNDLNCISQNKPIDELLQFTKFNPTRFTGMKIQCASALQFGQAINVKQCSPFKNLNDKTYLPDSYKNASQYDITRVEIPLDHFQYDNNTLIVWKILKQTSVTITLFGGAILNVAGEFDRKARLARQGLNRTFGPDYLNK
jgi:hypothetical protein